MIDTVVLVIPNGHKYIKEPERFNPSPRELCEGKTPAFGSRPFTKYVLNETKEGLRKGIYLPRLTLVARGSSTGLTYDLRIEFSVPKLLFLNNVDELEDKDFGMVINTLQERLKELGVWVFRKQLAEAAVSYIHFSKNFPLTDGYTASFVMNELSKLDVTKKLDLNIRHFQNSGHALYFYSKSYSIVFYDKAKDVTVPEGRAMDSDKTMEQLELFKSNLLQGLEILRYEVRITNKQKLKRLLKEVGYQGKLTFKGLFSSKLSQSVLTYYWNLIYDRSLFVINLSDSPERIFESITTQNRKPTSIKAFAILGLTLYAKEHGMRQLQTSICDSYSSRTWFRLRKMLDPLNKLSHGKNPFGIVAVVTGQLAKFVPFKAATPGLEGQKQ